MFNRGERCCCFQSNIGYARYYVEVAPGRATHYDKPRGQGAGRRNKEERPGLLEEKKITLDELDESDFCR